MPCYSRRRFMELAMGGMGLTLLSGCARGARILDIRPAPYVAQLQIRNPQQFKILQMTDLHFFSGKKLPEGMPNELTIQTMSALVKQAKPDLILVTGDSWPDSRGEAAYRLMNYVIERLEELNTPWAYTWGNHDELPDYARGHAAFASAKNSLYAGAGTEGNYVINIVDQRRRPVWQFLCLNSEKDGLGPRQQQWLRALEKDPHVGGAAHPPRFAVFHIPIKQYDTIWQNGTASGVMGETVCLEKEDGSSFALLKSLGVRACLCGHDHRNDYAGAIDGVDLIYGRATGAGGYGAELLRKGGKVYTINCRTGAYSWVALLPDGTEWRPKPGERVLDLEKK
jgi:hypothetical protein